MSLIRRCPNGGVVWLLAACALPRPAFAVICTIHYITN